MAREFRAFFDSTLALIGQRVIYTTQLVNYAEIGASRLILSRVINRKRWMLCSLNSSWELGVTKIVLIEVRVRLVAILCSFLNRKLENSIDFFFSYCRLCRCQLKHADIICMYVEQRFLTFLKSGNTCD